MSASTRSNRQLRTRKDLLAAAQKLLAAGKPPTMDEVAATAMVSRATAYRYFSSIEELLSEAPVDEAVPAAKELFVAQEGLSAEDRVDIAEAVMHEAAYQHETQLRLMLAHNLHRGRNGSDGIPVRQNRRTEYIEHALAPYRKDFDKTAYRTLSAALALIFGTEAMIVFRDVVPLPPDEARRIKSWAIKALVRAAKASRGA